MSSIYAYTASEMGMSVLDDSPNEPLQWQQYGIMGWGQYKHWYERSSNLTCRCLARLNAAGYTVEQITSNAQADALSVTVAETVSRVDLLAALTVIEPTLSLDKSSVAVPNDGVSTDTITITDSRGAAASGDKVKILWEGLFYVGGTELTLDGSGQATVQIGPCPVGLCTSHPNYVVFYREDNSTLPVHAMVGFGA